MVLYFGSFIQLYSLLSCSVYIILSIFVCLLMVCFDWLNLTGYWTLICSFREAELHIACSKCKAIVLYRCIDTRRTFCLQSVSIKQVEVLRWTSVVFPIVSVCKTCSTSLVALFSHLHVHVHTLLFALRGLSEWNAEFWGVLRSI